MQERYELEVLNFLNTKKFLSDLVFTGGTFLRLCHGLNRYSVDLDFWVKRPLDKPYFALLKSALEERYSLRDAANKHYSLLYELKSPDYPRSLKIEIRKEVKKVRIERSIAYSPHSQLQVLVHTVALEDMIRQKVEAFLDRNEIRDLFDIEFLVKRGIPLIGTREQMQLLLTGIRALSRSDFTVKLGSLLAQDQRSYYLRRGFQILEGKIQERLNAQRLP